MLKEFQFHQIRLEAGGDRPAAPLRSPPERATSAFKLVKFIFKRCVNIVNVYLNRA